MGNFEKLPRKFAFFQALLAQDTWTEIKPVISFPE